MEIAWVFAFVMVAGGPLIGMWRGHVWAKSQGMVLRSASARGARSQTA
jgi:hypothetical protein